MSFGLDDVEDAARNAWDVAKQVVNDGVDLVTAAAEDAADAAGNFFSNAPNLAEKIVGGAADAAGDAVSLAESLVEKPLDAMTDEALGDALGDGAQTPPDAPGTPFDGALQLPGGDGPEAAGGAILSVTETAHDLAGDAQEALAEVHGPVDLTAGDVATVLDAAVDPVAPLPAVLGEFASGDVGGAIDQVVVDSGQSNSSDALLGGVPDGVYNLLNQFADHGTNGAHPYEVPVTPEADSMHPDQVLFIQGGEVHPTGYSDVSGTLETSIRLASSAVSPVGPSSHDTMPLNHEIPLGSSGVSSVGSLDTLPINHSIQLSLPGALVFGPYDTIQHSIDHAREMALTGLDVDVSDSKHLLTGNQAVLLETDMIKAATEWMNHIDNPHHIPINILLNITDDDKNHPRFDGGPAFMMSNGTGDNATWESAVGYKLENDADSTTGLDGFPKLSDGAQADVVININSHYLNSTGWLDPNPPAGSPNDLPWSDPEWVPYYKVDVVSELAHEFGHGLGIGITSTLDTTTGRFGDGEKTTWESLLDIERSGAFRTGVHAYFTGSHAEREHGGPVVVTTNTPGENYGHIGNTLGDAIDPKTGLPDVMFGAYFNTGVRYEVSDLDVAILQDLGYRTRNPLDLNIAEVGHPSVLDIHSDIYSLVSMPPETSAILAANDATNLSTLLGESAGSNHSFWGQAAAASGISSLPGSDATQGLGTGTTANSLVTQIADQLSHLSSGAQSDIAAQVAHVAVPTLLADAHVAQLQFDIAHLSDFAHQLQI